MIINLMVLFVEVLSQTLQDSEDANDGALRFDRLLRQYPGNIRVQPVLAIGQALLRYSRTLGRKITSQCKKLIFLKTEGAGNPA